MKQRDKDEFVKQIDVQIDNTSTEDPNLLLLLEFKLKVLKEQTE